MAHCVISAVIDTDDAGSLFPEPACVVHAHWAPCPLDGDPASPLPLHALPGTTRATATRMWQVRTHRQRPLVIHRVDGRRAEEHDSGDSTTCACGPEVLAAEGDSRG
jgi:hypothetical protein